MNAMNQKNVRLAACIALFGVVALMLGAVRADSKEDAVPAAFVASPDVYKVVAENAQLRLILATFKPGQRDHWHSHPSLTSYFLTGCKARIHAPDGSYRSADIPMGWGGVQAPVHSHSFENAGNSECRILITERK